MYLHSSGTSAAENRTFETLFDLEGMKSIIHLSLYTPHPSQKLDAACANYITSMGFMKSLRCSYLLQLSKAYDLEGEIKRNVEYAVQKRCHCNFSSSAIYSGEFSCRTIRNAVIYRAIINGSSEILRADDIITYIEDWKKNDGTLLYNIFRLQLSQSCPISFESFSEVECRVDGDKEPACKSQSDGLLFESSTCYRFKSCDDGENAE